jgi:DNA polymerase-3 subunit epsilon
MFAIIDIETTGGNAKSDKITDICIIIHDGLSVVEKFTSLINPERYISPYITKLTGINNDMVKDAPKFYEIAKKIIEITEGKIFVAHNVEFDYGFIRQEFKSLGYTYEREKLCTVKLSRKLLPGFNSYSLGNICTRLGIENNARHRAEGDAVATSELFNILLAEKNKNKLFQKQGIEELNSLRIDKVKENIIKKLPEETGIYYFLDKNNSVIYVGKSKNIRNRGLSHLTATAVKTKKMLLHLYDIDYQITGSELVSLILENNEIKRILPFYNRSNKIPFFTHHLYFVNNNNVLSFEITDQYSGKENVIKSFPNYFSAREYLNKIITEYHLCLRYCGIDDNNGPCFNYQIRECFGICHGEESKEDYNKRALTLIQDFLYPFPNLIITEEGRHPYELCFIKIIQNKYYGYIYLDKSEIPNDPYYLFESIKKGERNLDTDLIVLGYIKKNKFLKITPIK